MSTYYGGTLTVLGRNMLATLVAGETLTLTRVVFGKGQLPSGVDPIDVTSLYNPVAAGTSSVPIVSNGVLSMICEYRNDLNGGLQEGFWLREFGIYARTNLQAEALIYYATLGDSPQPVNAYVENRVDTRRFPISIAMAMDAEVTVSYNPGAFITSGEAEDILQDMVDEATQDLSNTIIKSFTIPATGWVEVTPPSGDGYVYQKTVTETDATADMTPFIALDKPSLAIARTAGMCPTIQAVAGAIVFWSKAVPSQGMTGTLTLLS